MTGRVGDGGSDVSTPPMDNKNLNTALDSSASDDTASDSRPASRTRSGPTDSMYRVRSQNGYSVAEDETPEATTDNDGGEAQRNNNEKDPYEVVWDDGDNDPLCPRSFSKARKWLITFIVSHVSLCV